MLVEHLESYYRNLAAEQNRQPQRWNRASSIGMCPRRLAYTKLGVQGEPHTPRRMAIFHHGNYVDKALKDDLRMSVGGLVPERKEIEIEGVNITGEGDFMFRQNDRLGLCDIKSMSNFGFDRACRGEIEDTYQAQGWVYSRMYDVDLVVFVGYRKETAHICEVIFDAQAPELIVTQRFGGNEKQLYADDPLLITEVRTPFDGRIEERIRATCKLVREVSSLNELPSRPYEPVPETIKVQGKEKAKDYGTPIQQSGSWFTFATGRKILNFPCTYCQFIKHCWPEAFLEIKEGKPAWIVPSLTN